MSYYLFMNNANASRVRFYEESDLRSEVDAIGHDMRARRERRLAETWHGAAARCAGEARAYGDKAAELRGL